VRLVDGREVIAGRDRLSLRRAYQHELAVGAGPTTGPGATRLVEQHTIYAAVVGSRAFGLATGASDTDIRGVYAAPTPAFWSLVKPPPHVEGPDPEWFSWEVERFCELALKAANRNLLEVLHSPLVVRCTALGEELLDLRPAFLSQLVYQTYSGYVLSQFTKLEADLRRQGEPRWKHVMQLIRLLLSAREMLKTGRLEVDAGRHRDCLLAVRRGELTWDQVEQWRLRLHRDLDDVLEHTPLPAAPDVARVDAWLRSVRERSVRKELA
jgi:predicted nucleotidyltransferase